MERYGQVSREIMAVFEAYSPKIQQISIDEAFIDMTGTERLFGSVEGTAARLKEQVLRESGLTISVGAAPNRYLAKMASEFDKPDGLWIVKSGEETGFLDQLSLNDLWGIGKKTLERLEECNITSVAGLRNFSQGALKTMFGKAAGEYLYKAVRGEDPGIHREAPKSRSISSETTFPADTRDKDVLFRALLELSHQVMFRMMNEKFKTKTIALKLRSADFSTSTAQTTLRHYVGSAEEVYDEARKLLAKRWNNSELIRLIGVGLTSLEKAGVPGQPELFEDKYDKKKKVEQAVLGIKNRMPSGSIVKASLLKKDKRRG
jgi:DNA polymerase-4